MKLTIRGMGKVRGEDAMRHTCPAAMFDTLRFVAGALGVNVCHYYRGSFHFALSKPGLTVAVKPDSAGRLRVSTCFYAVERDRKWCSLTDRARLARLVADATEVMVDDALPNPV